MLETVQQTFVSVAKELIQLIGSFDDNRFVTAAVGIRNGAILLFGRIHWKG